MLFFKKLLYSESYKKGIILSVVFNVCSKGLLFLVNIVIAFYFGVNTETDIYFYLNSTIIILASYINNIDVAVLIPELMRRKHHDEDESYKTFINFFLYLYILIGVAGVAILFFFNGELYGLISNFSTATILSHRTMFLIGSFNFLLLIIINYLVNILTSLKYFTLPMIVSVVNSVLILLVVVLGHQRLGTTGIIIGATIGQFINVMLLLILMKVNLKWEFGWIPKTFSIRKKVWKDIVWVEMGQLTALATNYLPIYILSSFSNGAITAMNFGKNIAEIPNSLVTNQYSYIVGIKFNELYHKSNFKELARTFVESGKILVLILIPISCFLSFHSTEVVNILLAHGSFNKSNAEMTSVFLSIFSLAIPFIAVGALITRLCFAAQRARFIFFYQIISNIFLIAAIFIATHYFKIFGYAYGYLIFHVLNVLISFYVCRLLLAELQYLKLVMYTFAIIAGYIALSALLFLLHNNSSNIFYLFLDAALFLLLFLFLGRRWLSVYYIKYKERKIKTY